MDTISVSNVLGLAYTLFERGVITPADTGGILLEWGDQAAAEQLIPRMAAREGFGGQLAEGALALGRRYGVEADAVQVNGLEVPYHDPRGASGMGLVYATSPRGACHNQSDYFLVEIGQIEESLGMNFYPRHVGGEKAANVALHQDWRTLCNALVYCFFANVSPLTMKDLINAAMGTDWDIPDLLEAGARAWNLKRVINHRLGLSRENDRLPKPLLKAYQEGGAAGFELDFPGMLTAYYEARNWDQRTGFPTREVLVNLDLGWAVNDLWPDN
jgi:aldehyde:ferredoxin oxidoreductase